MNVRRSGALLSVVAVVVSVSAPTATAQCCLNDLFAGCASCFRRAPAAYAVAPVAAPLVAAPQPYAMAPVPAPPPPVVVPVQQVSYVPETTYRTQYQCVPVTSYKPSTEIDPCTGCPRECMQQVTQYVQQAVNVPVTQYRAVYSTKYVQMQPGSGQAMAPQAVAPQPLYGQPLPMAPAPAVVTPGPAGAATSPFAAPLQTTPQAWGSAGADIPQQLIPGQSSIAAPTLSAPPTVSQPVVPQPTYQQQIVPQSGTYAAPPVGISPQPTVPPTLTPTPALRPIPELPRGSAAADGSPAPKGEATPGAGAAVNAAPAIAPPALTPAPTTAPSPAATAPATPPGGVGTGATMPTLQGAGPAANTGAFPRLLEPTGHTTSWQPTAPSTTAVANPSGYPRTALPARLALGVPQP